MREPDPWFTRWIQQFTSAQPDATKTAPPMPAPGPSVGAAPNKYPTPKTYPAALSVIPGFQEGVDAATGDWGKAAKGMAGYLAAEAVGPVFSKLAKLRAGQRAAAQAEAALSGRVLTEPAALSAAPLRQALGAPSEADLQALLDAITPKQATPALSEAEARAEYLRRTRQPFPKVEPGPGPSPQAVAERTARAARGRR